MKTKVAQDQSNCLTLLSSHPTDIRWTILPTNAAEKSSRAALYFFADVVSYGHSRKTLILRTENCLTV